MSSPSPLACVTPHVARYPSLARLAAPRVAPAHQQAGTRHLRQLASRPRRSWVVSATAGSEDAGSAFVQQYTTLSTSQPLNTSSASRSCCGSSSSSSSEQSGSGCCSSSSSASSGSGTASGQASASATMSQLNSMMGGMQGSLSRKDIWSAFEASQPAITSSLDSGYEGERFLDIVSILHGRGEGNNDDDADLDALIV